MLHCKILAETSFYCAQEFNQQALSNTLWSYAILRHHPGQEFMDAAAEQIQTRLGEFNAQVLYPAFTDSNLFHFFTFAGPAFHFSSHLSQALCFSSYYNA